MDVFLNYLDKIALNKKIDSGLFPFEQKLFWDTDIEKIDLQKHKDAIIERVICRGILEDFYILNKIYLHEEIIIALKKAKVLDPKTANFCANYYEIDKSQIHDSSNYA